MVSTFACPFNHGLKEGPHMFKIIALLVMAFVAAGCVGIPVDDRPIVGGLHLGKNEMQRPVPADVRLPRSCTYDNDGTKYGSVICEQVQVVAVPMCGPYGCPVVAPAYSSMQIWGGRGHSGFTYGSGPMFGPFIGPMSPYGPLRCDPWGPRCW